MDLYTTSFTYPRPAPHTLRSSSPLPSSGLNLPGSASVQPVPLPNVTSATTPLKKPSSSPLTTAAQVQTDWENVQKLALEITSREGCLVTVTKEQTNVELGASSPNLPGTNIDATNVIPDATVWNFHLSGGYQSVMAARGAILREIPRDNRTVLKVARTDLLESPLQSVSPLKLDVKRRLDQIAADSKALISVVNLEMPGGGVGGIVLAVADGKAVHDTPSKLTTEDGPTTAVATEDGSAPPSVDGNTTGDSITDVATAKTPEPNVANNAAPAVPGAITYGLETERMCELVITGPIESVEIAKVRLLVMLDELVRCTPVDMRS